MPSSTPLKIPVTFPARERRTAASSWLERTNPLSGLTIRQAQAIYDAARGGDFSRIQYIYAELEKANPVLMTCVDRRASAISGLGWKVSTTADGAEADEQKEAVERALLNADGLDDALEHLALAFFRGFAHVRPIWGGRPGELLGFDKPHNWNFARDRATGAWYWNASAEPCDPTRPDARLVPVPPGELVTIERVREIDFPAMALALRHAVGERDWGRFLERYGLPFVVMVAPPDADADSMGAFATSAEKITDGLSTVVPSGTDVSFAGEARGADPFTPFVEHVQKLIVLMATGGTLTSLAEAGAGTLAGNAQMQVWEQIVKRDGVAIGATLDKGIVRRIVRALFPGRQCLVKFELGGDRQLEPGEIFDLAAKARAAGYRIDKAQLEEATGYTLVEESAAQMPFPMNTRKKAKNAAARPIERVLSTYREELGEAAAQLEALLALPDDELPAAAARLAARLPEMLPADPAMAAAMAEDLAAAFAEAAGESGAAQNAEKCPECGQWLDGHGVCHACRGADEAATNGENPDSAETQAAEIGKGKAAIKRCLEEKRDVPDAFSRGDIGLISILYGSPVDTPEGKAWGLSHFAQRKDTLEHIPETVIRGTAQKPYQDGQKQNIAFGKYTAVLTLSNDPKKPPKPMRWIFTAFQPDDMKSAGGHR